MDIETVFIGMRKRSEIDHVSILVNEDWFIASKYILLHVAMFYLVSTNMNTIYPR